MSKILLVGGNSGIGYHMAKAFLEKGHQVAVLDVATKNIEKLQASFPKTLLSIVADATHSQSIEAGVHQTLNQFGEIDMAVYNACLCTFQCAGKTDMDMYRKVFEINYFGAVRMAKAVLPGMRASQKGRVIFTSSGVGVTGFYNISPYASTKGALEAFAKCLRIENEPYHVFVHIIHPPLTDTFSAGGIKIPKKFKADAKTVGIALVERMEEGRLKDSTFMICPSFAQTLQMKFSYRHPLFIGRMMTKMTKKAENELQKE